MSTAKGKRVSLSFVAHGIIVAGDVPNGETKTEDNPRDHLAAAVLLDGDAAEGEV
jgi:hypothetical protein